ncbi:MAG: hypothetical protein ACO3X1_15285, partial [Burkholderiaceae bacterium]
LTTTDMYFDDELLGLLDDTNWKSFKATLLVYTLNLVNRYQATGATSYNPVPLHGHSDAGEHHDRGFEGATSHP